MKIHQIVINRQCFNRTNSLDNLANSLSNLKQLYHGHVESTKRYIVVVKRSSVFESA